MAIPTIDIVNPVGSGDATLAGLAIGIRNNDDIEILLKRGMAFGILNAQEKTTGYINLDNYDKLLKK